MRNRFGSQVLCLALMSYALVFELLFLLTASAADAFPEVLLQETGGSGRIKFWYTDTASPTVLSSVPIQPPTISDPAWRIKGLGDFNRTNPTSIPEIDMLLQYHEGFTDSAIGFWYLEGLNRYAASLLTFPYTNWNVVGAGDFNGDGHADLVMQVKQGDPLGGLIGIWYLGSGGQYLNAALTDPAYPGGVPNSGWTVKSVTDWNNDGNADLIFQHTYYIAVWLMSGVSCPVGSRLFFTPNAIENGFSIKGAGLVPPTSTSPPQYKGLVISSPSGTIKAWPGVAGSVPTLATTSTPYFTSDPSSGFDVVGLESFNRVDYVDSDYDGRSDLEEASDGTNPFDPGACIRTRLARWTFNDSWNTLDGRAPLITPTALRVASAGFDGQAFQAETTGQMAVYRDVEPSGNRPANINTRSGTIRLFYKPSWTGAPGGSTELRLFEMDAFSLSILPNGNLQFRVPNVLLGTGSIPVVESQLSWSSANGWYEIVLAYSPNNFDCYIAVNGTKLGNLVSSSGVQAFPRVAARQNGFFIGNGADGTKPARGLIDEVETYNYPMKLGEATRLWEAVSAEVLTGGTTGLRLSWSPGNSLDAGGLVPSIQRRLDNDSSSVVNLTLASGTANTIDDTTVVAGQRYEYFIGNRLHLAGVSMTNGLPVQTARGRMILVPALNLWADLSSGPLASDYSAFKSGLVGDGWDVVETAPQPLHPSGENWGVVGSSENNTYKANLAATKSAILAQRDLTKLNVVLLLGHVTVPYSGTIFEDGHNTCADYHQGAWPADIYYGVTASWFGSSDVLTQINPTCATAVLNNYPSDGKFDADTFITSPLSSRLEMPVGRIDFASMAAFSPNEAGLMQRYFQKVNGYRALAAPYYSSIPKRMTTGLFFGEDTEDKIAINRALSRQSRRMANAVLGSTPLGITYGDVFTNNIPSLWTTMGGNGAVDAIRNLDGTEPMALTTTQQLATNTKQAKALFFMVDGSWFVDWNANNGTNTFLKAVLGMNIYGLSVQWSHLSATFWNNQNLGAGDTTAHVMLRTIQRDLPVANQSVRSTFILGDPSLRPLWSSPVLNVRKDTAYTGSGCRVLWDLAAIQTGTAPTYHVFRGGVGSLAYSSLTYLGSTPGTSFTDSGALTPPYTYWIRSVNTVTTGAGSFVDFGQAGSGDIN